MHGRLHCSTTYLLTYFLQDRAQLALLALAAVNELPVVHGPMTKSDYDEWIALASAPATPQSPFPLRENTHTRLKLEKSKLVNVPGSINGKLGYQRWGYGLGSVSARL